jgi:hypothetical protein
MGRLLAVSTLLLTWPSATQSQTSANVTTTRKPAAASHPPGPARQAFRGTDRHRWDVTTIARSRSFLNF